MRLMYCRFGCSPTSASISLARRSPHLSMPWYVCSPAYIYNLPLASMNPLPKFIRLSGHAGVRYLVHCTCACGSVAGTHCKLLVVCGWVDVVVRVRQRFSQVVVDDLQHIEKCACRTHDRKRAHSTWPLLACGVRAQASGTVTERCERTVQLPGTPDKPLACTIKCLYVLAAWAVLAWLALPRRDRDFLNLPSILLPDVRGYQRSAADVLASRSTINGAGPQTQG